MQQGYGMFGPTPYDVNLMRQARDLEEVKAIDSGGPSVGIGLLARKGFNALGDAMGIPDPGMERGKKMKEIVDKLRASGIDINNPEEFYPAMVSELQAAGLNNEAMAMADKFRSSSLEAALKGAQTAKANAEATKAARESHPDLVKYQRALAEARARGAPPEVIQQLTDKILKLSAPDVTSVKEGDGEDVREVIVDRYGNKVYSGNPYKQKPTVSVSNDLRQGQNAFAEVNKKQFDKIVTDYQAYDSLSDTMRQMNEIVKSGNLNTGITAGMKTQYLRALTAAGIIDEKGAATLSNDELMKKFVVDVVLPKMKQLGGSDSNEELRKLSESVPNSSMSIPTLKRLIRAYEFGKRRVSKRYNSLSKYTPDQVGGSFLPISGYGEYDAETLKELNDEFGPENYGNGPVGAAPAPVETRPKPAAAKPKVYFASPADYEKALRTTPGPGGKPRDEATIRKMMQRYQELYGN